MEDLKMMKPQNQLTDQIDEFMPKVVDTLGSSNLKAVEVVQTEAEALLRLAENEAETLAKSAIDPLAPRAKLTEAKKQADLAIQYFDCLQYAWEQLTAKSSELHEIEFKKSQLSQYQTAANLRNFVAKRIREEFRLIFGNATELAAGKDTNVGRDISRSMDRYTPGRDLPGIGLAMDRLFWDHLQTFLDPESAAKMKKRAAQGANTGSAWWLPGTITPDRAPSLLNAEGK